MNLNFVVILSLELKNSLPEKVLFCQIKTALVVPEKFSFVLKKSVYHSKSYK